MSKDDKQTVKQDTTVPTQKQETQAPANQCPDCDGEGIKNPTDTSVCATCEGRGVLGSV